jgi:hypothetical protein
MVSDALGTTSEINQQAAKEENKQAKAKKKIMKQIVKLNWKIADLIREEQSFANWHWNVFKLAPSPKDLKDIKKRERELAQMKQAVLDAEV